MVRSSIFGIRTQDTSPCMLMKMDLVCQNVTQQSAPASFSKSPLSVLRHIPCRGLAQLGFPSLDVPDCGLQHTYKQTTPSHSIHIHNLFLLCNLRVSETYIARCFFSIFLSLP